MDPYEELLAILERLNFTHNESIVYLALIKIGSSKAGAISKEARLDRSSTYNALKGLIERGLVSTIFDTKRTTYVPSSPESILDNLKEKEELAKRAIPLLEQRFKASKPKSQVTLYKGYRGLKTVFNDVLASKTRDYCIIGSEGQFTDKMPSFSPIFRERKVQEGINTRMLVREDVEAQRSGKSRGSRTKVKIIPSYVHSTATINIYEKKVAIIIWEERPEAVLIENEKVAASFKSYFDFMWDNAR